MKSKNKHVKQPIYVHLCILFICEYKIFQSIYKWHKTIGNCFVYIVSLLARHHQNPIGFNLQSNFHSKEHATYTTHQNVYFIYTITPIKMYTQ